MPTVTKVPAFLVRFKQALIDALKKSGIPAEVSFQRVPTTRLYRVWVLAPKFRHMRPSERQDFVWRIAENTLKPDEQLRISMILTLEDADPGR